MRGESSALDNSAHVFWAYRYTRRVFPCSSPSSNNTVTWPSDNCHDHSSLSSFKLYHAPRLYAYAYRFRGGGTGEPVFQGILLDYAAGASRNGGKLEKQGRTKGKPLRFRLLPRSGSRQRDSQEPHLARHLKWSP